MIGLSLSLCVADIIAGRVREEDVEKIIASTCCESREQWEALIKKYREYYWDKNPDLAESLCWRLIFANKIEQPRLKDPLYFLDINDSHWIAEHE